jgi:hypothetical protein
VRYAIVDPESCSVTISDHETIEEATVKAGLRPGHVDHGMIRRDLALFVDEFGLFYQEGVRYFSIHRQLYAGAAVLYACDIYSGETRDLHRNQLPPVVFYRDAAEVERSIGLGAIERPMMKMNNKTVWRWPEPSPLDARGDLRS